MLLVRGQVSGIDFDDGSEQHDLPLGTPPSDICEQSEIHPLVDHARKTEPRVRDA